ncbi:Protein CBG15211 [Caenorhabditis briggsae]|uniref:Phorbol-ester/DAG-type domain-containing protein n=3 Tax=Caenorhabditis briggsae TaxID=6238 RepID=A0AAE9IKZ1_CAEBR|nr:Protein CBG15211 [Caenorhabditis briggsae]ULT98451.1 hypothetical protein L3Y34_000076 [Caenorhabditis briggsae]CAP33540.1 Protein CBG15211 [Caenorhabditis briggsae]
MSYCSSEEHTPISRSRKSSWLISKIDENEVDKEIQEMMDEWRRRDAEKSHVDLIQAALNYCRGQLKELLVDGEGEEEEGKSKPIDIISPEHEERDVLGNLVNCLDRQQKAARQQMYFDKIVQLGLERQALQDESGEPTHSTDECRAEGHEFVMQPVRGGHNPCCEVCMHTIWRLVQWWRRCRVCGMRAHDKCAEDVKRVCAGVLSTRSKFELNINLCEERSLAEQEYQCAECSAPICFDGTSEQEARLCDYSGELFCPNCHWNDTWSIPARIIHNLDATPRPICRAVKQLLSIVDHRPLIDINESTLSLIKFHKELRRVNELRRNFLLMKCYFVSCRTARRLRILQYLQSHSHFVDNAVMYSLKELRELCEGKLLPELEQIHTVFRKHIEEECETCAGNGFFCELCDDVESQENPKDKVLYPFTENTRSCATCLAVYHKKCFERKSLNCPRCERRRRRSEIPKTLTTSSSSDEKETAAGI